MSKRNVYICDGCGEEIKPIEVTVTSATPINRIGLGLAPRSIGEDGHLCEQCNAIVCNLIDQGYLTTSPPDIQKKIIDTLAAMQGVQS